MVTYWDSSALVPLVVREATTKFYTKIAEETGIVTWWGSYLECTSAIAQLARRGSAPTQVAESYRMLEQLAGEWGEIGVSEKLRRAAARILKTHGLRTSDALQLGAGIVASGFEPHIVRFVAEDKRLRQAAEREGFVVH
jgi:predicted nucleic acid-binding protein